MPLSDSEGALIAAAQHLFGVVAAERWTEVPALVDPCAMASLRDSIVRAADSWVRPLASFPSVMESLNAQPESERDRLRGQIATHRSEGLQRLLSAVPGVSSIDELLGVTPEDLLVRWCQAHATTWRAAPQHSALPVERRVLGVVLETAARGYVVYALASSSNAADSAHVSLLRFIRVGERWLLGQLPASHGDLPLLDGPWTAEFQYGVGFDF